MSLQQTLRALRASIAGKKPAVVASLRHCGVAGTHMRARAYTRTGSRDRTSVRTFACVRVIDTHVPATPQRRKRGAGLRHRAPARLPATPQTYSPAHAPANLSFQRSKKNG